MRVLRNLVACLVLAGGFVVAAPVAVADGCYNCGSGSSSSCNQCRYGDKDTSDARKACEKKGCKISGTSSCSSAANVKVCKVEPAANQGAYEVAWAAKRAAAR